MASSEMASERRVCWVTGVIVLRLLLTLVLFLCFVDCEFGYDRTRHSQRLYNQTFPVNPLRQTDLPFFFTAGDSIYGEWQVRDFKTIDFYVFNSVVYHSGRQDSSRALVYTVGSSRLNCRFVASHTDTLFFVFRNRNPDTLRVVTLVVDRVFWEEE